MIRKIIIANGRSEREVLLVGNITIGRDPACHINESDPLLSRRHAEVIVNVHGVSIRDLDSRNGLLVNGQKTREQVLLPGDLVQLGHLQLRYVEEDARAADAMPGRRIAHRRPVTQPPPAATQGYDFDRFRPEHTPQPQLHAHPQPHAQPRRWTPEPTPLPGRRTSAPPRPHAPPQQPRVQQFTPVPRGRAAFDESVPVQHHAYHDTTLGHVPANLDATILAPMSTREPSGPHRWSDPNSTMLGSAPPPDATMGPGNETFASALAHLSGLSDPDIEPVHTGPGARLVANAELTVTDATPDCADLLGIPDEELIGDSLTDVFLRGVRRVYAEPDSTLSLSLARGRLGSITVTFTLDKTGGTE